MAKIIDNLILCIGLACLLHFLLSTFICKMTSAKVRIDFDELMRKSFKAEMNIIIIFADLLMLKCFFIDKPVYILLPITIISFVFDIVFLILYIVNSFDFVVFINHTLKSNNTITTYFTDFEKESL